MLHGSCRLVHGLWRPEQVRYRSKALGAGSNWMACCRCMAGRARAVQPSRGMGVGVGHWTWVDAIGMGARSSWVVRWTTGALACLQVGW